MDNLIIMEKNIFLAFMNFPKEWLEYGMYPDELFYSQLHLYQPGDEEGSEHYRNGAFHWWLKRKPTTEQLSNLVKLTFLDPDALMGNDVRNYMRFAYNFDTTIKQQINLSDI